MNNIINRQLKVLAQNQQYRYLRSGQTQLGGFSFYFYLVQFFCTSEFCFLNIM